MSKKFRPSPDALLNPCADPTFKALFTSENEYSRGALVDFLQTMIGRKISELRLQPNELSGESIFDKHPEFDITCKVDDEYANIEFQGQNDHFSFGNRAEYHVAHLLNHYTTKGTAWADIPKVYQISLLNFIFDAEEPSPVNLYVLKNHNNHTIAEKINVIFIELPKIAAVSDDVETLTNQEIWGKFFLYAADKNKRNYIDKLCEKNGGIDMATVALSYISEDEANWIRETRYWTYVSDELTKKNYMDKMMKKIEDGQNELEKGKSELEKNKSELEKNKSELEKNKSELEKDKSELEKDKSELEKQKNELKMQLNELVHRF